MICSKQNQLQYKDKTRIIKSGYIWDIWDIFTFIVYVRMDIFIHKCWKIDWEKELSLSLSPLTDIVTVWVGYIQIYLDYK